mmetsp:Transcript_30023/g.61812  ORF Transcript_30023/g.61812 Transcript_30023/m.61812 type:complete len:178 (+) Transcript_30023:191-724(+)
MSWTVSTVSAPPTCVIPNKNVSSTISAPTATVIVSAPTTKVTLSKSDSKIPSRAHDTQMRSSPETVSTSSFATTRSTKETKIPNSGHPGKTQARPATNLEASNGTTRPAPQSTLQNLAEEDVPPMSDRNGSQLVALSKGGNAIRVDVKQKSDGTPVDALPVEWEEDEEWVDIGTETW